MSQNRTIRLTPKINIEVWVESETTFLCVHINLQQVGPVLQHVWVELFIPRGEQVSEIFVVWMLGRVLRTGKLLLEAQHVLSQKFLV